MIDVGLVLFLIVLTKYLTRKQFKTGSIHLDLQVESTSHHREYGRKQGTGKTLGHIAATGNRVKRKLGGATKPEDPPPRDLLPTARLHLFKVSPGPNAQ